MHSLIRRPGEGRGDRLGESILSRSIASLPQPGQETRNNGTLHLAHGPDIPQAPKAHASRTRPAPCARRRRA